MGYLDIVVALSDIVLGWVKFESDGYCVANSAIAVGPQKREHTCRLNGVYPLTKGPTYSTGAASGQMLVGIRANGFLRSHGDLRETLPILTIPIHKVVGAGMKLIIHTGLFDREYEEWHKRAQNMCT